VQSLLKRKNTNIMTNETTGHLEDLSYHSMHRQKQSPTRERSDRQSGASSAKRRTIPHERRNEARSVPVPRFAVHNARASRPDTPERLRWANRPHFFPPERKVLTLILEARFVHALIIARARARTTYRSTIQRSVHALRLLLLTSK